MPADEPRLGYALWDLVHALTTMLLLLSPLLAAAGLGWLVWKRQG